MNIIKNKTIFVSISLVLVVLSLGSLLYFGLKQGIEFTGGTAIEVVYPKDKPSLEEVNNILEKSVNLVQPIEDGYLIRTSYLSDEQRQELIKKISFNNTKKVEEKRVSSIGPSIGSELKTKAGYAIVSIVLLTIIFIAYSFRKVSKPVSSWWYGVIAIITLIHDVLIPSGIYAYMGSRAGWEVDVLFVTALLAIFGLSINDTIVIFDRIRENITLNEEKNKQESFSEVVQRSLSESFTRSANTSITTIITLFALYFFGSESTNHFAAVLLIGMIVGTYSSLFLASPLLIYVEEWQQKRKRTSNQ